MMTKTSILCDLFTTLSHFNGAVKYDRLDTLIWCKNGSPNIEFQTSFIVNTQIKFLVFISFHGDKSAPPMTNTFTRLLLFIFNSCIMISSWIDTTIQFLMGIAPHFSKNHFLFGQRI